MPAYTLNQYYQQRIPINGKARQRPALVKVMDASNKSPVGYNNHNAAIYSLEDVEDAFRTYEANLKVTKAAGTKSTSNRNLVEEKLKEQIDRLKQDKVLADLKIQEMQKDLVASKDVKEIYAFHMETMNAILRRVLLINAPTEIPGLSIPDAINRCKDYYNEIQKVMQESPELLQSNGEDILNERLKSIIDRFNNALLPPVSVKTIQ